MGMFRNGDEQEIDIVKEMAEGLGSQGLKVEDLLEKAEAARGRVRLLYEQYANGNHSGDGSQLAALNASIHEYNGLVDKAEDALRWLLIQREACGFRTHKHVDHFYPIPEKIRPIKS